MNPLLPLLEGQSLPAGVGQRLLLGFLAILGKGYGQIQSLRALGYEKGLFPTFQAPCPVISVGNLTAGGTGKTPMVLWLAGYFQAKNIPVAIVSRGYGQGSREAITVVADGRGARLFPPLAADEATLLAGRLPNTPILTGPNRRILIQHAVRHLGVRLVIMDDGFQHLQVARACNLVLVDARTPWGNGKLLPGGVLRESPRAIVRAHGVILTRCLSGEMALPVQEEIHRLAPHLPVAWCNHRPTGWIRPGDHGMLPLDTLQGQKVFAFCGIAQPMSFRTTLEDMGLELTGFRPFPDHHPFGQEEMDRLVEEAKRSRAQALVVTEKDGVKLHGRNLGLPWFALGVEMNFPTPPTWLLQRLEGLARRVA